VPFQGPPPDLPGSPDGLRSPGFRTFPRNLVKTVPSPPGKGGEVNVVSISLSAVPTPLEQNAAWQQVNKELGVNLKMAVIGTGDYAARLSTVIAGNALPDILMVSAYRSVFPNMAEFLEASCADLTPYLGGDAVQEYPNLANFPTSAWPPTVFNNKIYAVPLVPGGAATGSGGGVLMAQWKLFDEIGVSGFQSVDDFTKALKQITIPNQRWAVGGGSSANPASLAGWLSQVFGGANQWRESGGKLTRSFETEELKQAVAYGRSLWDAGAVGAFGGGIANFGIVGSPNPVTSQLTLVNTVVENNSATSSGGGFTMNQQGARLTIQTSTVASNTAQSAGGGIAIGGSGATTLIMDASTVRDNTAVASFGGGLGAFLSSTGTSGISIAIDRTTFHNNQAGTSSGGIAFGGPNSTLSITNSTFSSNRANGGNGGAMALGGSAPGISPGQLTLTNITISGNIASGGGGGIASSLLGTVTNATIVGNGAGTSGGGLSVRAGTMDVPCAVAGKYCRRYRARCRLPRDRSTRSGKAVRREFRRAGHL